MRKTSKRRIEPKSVDLSNINVTVRGYDWVNSIGAKIDFVYGDIVGDMEVVGYSDGKVEVKYKDKTKKFVGRRIMECKIGVLVGGYSYDFLFEIGDIVGRGERKLKIIQQIREGGKERSYICECLSCGNESTRTEHNLKSKPWCTLCSEGAKVVTSGINDINTTNKDVCVWLKNKEDSYKYSKGSHQKVICKCVICNAEKEITVSKLCERGFSCPSCSDGFSYPERLMFNVIRLSGVSFTHRVTFDWSENKEYDFYIDSLKAIIEVHGGQHYEDSFQGISNRTSEEEQENDRYKEQLAKENGIEHYVVIDCRKSELKWIKRSIETSHLRKLLGYENIDYKECQRNAVRSFVLDVCESYNQGSTIDELAVEFSKATETIKSYLKHGHECGFCDFDYNEYKHNRRLERSTQIVIIDESGKEFYFESIRKAHREMRSNGHKMSIKYITNNIDKNEFINGYMIKSFEKKGRLNDEKLQ